MSGTSAYQYRVGGHLPIDAPSYVVRSADHQFYQTLKAGELCYVLNSRQMGKTSLRFRTMNLLQQDGLVCVAIDLQGIGSRNITPQQWYAGLVKRLVQGLNLSSHIDLRSWWQEREVISPVQRFSEFIEIVLPKFIDQPITIFIDEVDSILSLDFDTDDFFAAIRACSEFPHINFALIGVATPGDLIQDLRRSPFNIGKAIELRGFQSTEVQPLVYGLTEKAIRPEVVLAAILDWTGGQPFLTQKLCKLVQELDTTLPSHGEQEFVANLVRSKIITNWETQDEPEHLKTIRNYLLHSDQPNTWQTLHIYQQIMTHGSVLADNSSDQLDLRLSGLVVKNNDRIQVCNQIYAQVFDRPWLERVLVGLRPQNPKIPSHNSFRIAFATIAIIITGSIGLVLYPPIKAKFWTPASNPKPEPTPPKHNLMWKSRDFRLHHEYHKSLLFGVKAAKRFRQRQRHNPQNELNLKENLWESLQSLQRHPRHHDVNNVSLDSLITESCDVLHTYLKTAKDLSAEERETCDQNSPSPQVSTRKNWQ
jgi:AAA-like domain